MPPRVYPLLATNVMYTLGTMPCRITRAEFQSQAEAALKTLPANFKKRLKNISIVIEDYPSRADAASVGVSRHQLLGLFSGGGYPQKDLVSVLASLPDRVVLYQKNIERHCATKEELREEIRNTLLHEIGHYFGMSEEELEDF